MFRCRRAAVILCLAVTVLSCTHQTVRAKPASFEPGAGHAVFSAFPECFATVMTNFLDQPANFDSSCVAAEQVSPFVTS